MYFVVFDNLRLFTVIVSLSRQTRDRLVHKYKHRNHSHDVHALMFCAHPKFALDMGHPGPIYAMSNSIERAHLCFDTKCQKSARKRG